MKPLSQTQQENIQNKLLDRAIYFSSYEDYIDGNFSALLERAGFMDDRNWNTIWIEKRRAAGPTHAYLRLIKNEDEIPFFSLLSDHNNRILINLQEALSILTMYDNKSTYKEQFFTFRGSQTGQEYQVNIRFNTQDSFDRLTEVEQEEIAGGLDEIMLEIEAMNCLVHIRNLPQRKLGVVVEAPDNYTIPKNSLILNSNDTYITYLTPQMIFGQTDKKNIVFNLLVRPLENTELKELSQLVFNFIK